MRIRVGFSNIFFKTLNLFPTINGYGNYIFLVTDESNKISHDYA